MTSEPFVRVDPVRAVRLDLQLMKSSEQGGMMLIFLRCQHMSIHTSDIPIMVASQRMLILMSNHTSHIPPRMVPFQRNFKNMPLVGTPTRHNNFFTK